MSESEHFIKYYIPLSTTFRGAERLQKSLDFLNNNKSNVSNSVSKDDNLSRSKNVLNENIRYINNKSFGSQICFSTKRELDNLYQRKSDLKLTPFQKMHLASISYKNRIKNNIFNGIYPVIKNEYIKDGLYFNHKFNIFRKSSSNIACTFNKRHLARFNKVLIKSKSQIYNKDISETNNKSLLDLCKVEKIRNSPYKKYCHCSKSLTKSEEIYYNDE